MIPLSFTLLLAGSLLVAVGFIIAWGVVRCELNDSIAESIRLEKAYRSLDSKYSQQLKLHEKDQADLQDLKRLLKLATEIKDKQREGKCPF